MPGNRKSLALQTAENELASLRTEWIRHVKGCGTCIVTTAARRRFCDTGWSIAKRGAAAATTVRDLQAAAAAAEPTLF